MTAIVCKILGHRWSVVDFSKLPDLHFACLRCKKPKVTTIGT